MQVPPMATGGGTAENVFWVGGHRGMGQNRAPLAAGASEAPPEQRYRPRARENTVLALNQAADCGANFVEFDVQVTRDGHPVLFHDNLIWTTKGGTGQGEHEALEGRRIPDLSLEEFNSISIHDIPRGKLARKRRDGSWYAWREAEEDAMPRLEEVFRRVAPSLHFNVELKFPADDSVDVTEADVAHMLDHVIPVVKAAQAGGQDGRQVLFSSFVPQAVIELRRREPLLQVYFLTVGQPGLFQDERMNSVEAAIALCKAYSLTGLVSEVGALLGAEGAVSKAKAAGLRVITWGDGNNIGSTVSLQKSKGVDAVIVDDVVTALSAIR